MRNNTLSFHIAREHGFEFVFSSGHALRYPMHTHVSTYTVTLVRKGVVRLAGTADAATLLPGSVYVVAPHEPHSPAYSDDFDIVSLCIDKGRVASTPFGDLLALLLPHARAFTDAARVAGAARLEHEHLCRLIAGVERIYARAPRAPYPDAPALLRTGPHDTESPFQRIRRFKKSAGLTPHQYAVQDRIRTAKRLLADATPIAEAAAEAGFCDQSHLNRWFQKALGMTPRAYKNACRFLDER